MKYIILQIVTESHNCYSSFWPITTTVAQTHIQYISHIHTYIHTYIHTFKNNVQQVWLAPGHGYIFDKLFSMIEGHLHYNF